MALPIEMFAPTLPQAYEGLKTKVIELQPANATGTTKFGANGANRIMFNLPAYPNAYLQTSRSFLSFRGKVKCGSTNSNGHSVAFKDGLPVFERLVVRGGNGVLLEDIRDYEVIERMLSNLDDWNHIYADSHEIGDFRAQRDATGLKGEIFMAGAANAGKYGGTENGIDFQEKTYRKPLISGIFGKDQDKALPIGLMSATGGFAFQVELYLNSNEKVCEDLNESGVEQPTYELSDVKLTLSLLETPADVYARLNARLVQNDRYVLPFKRLQSHKHYLDATGTKFNINIHESAKNVERLMAVMRPQGGNKLDFVGGADSDHKIKMFQTRYGTMYHPQAPIEVMSEKDSTLMLSHALAGMDMLEAGQPLLGTWFDYGTGGTANKCVRWEYTDFMLLQSYKTSKDEVANGLNSLSSGAPIVLDLTFSTRAATAEALEMLVFMVEDQKMVLGNGGSIALME